MSESMAYVGHCPTCGAMYAAHVITGQNARHLRKFLGELAKDGARIETVTCERVRSELAFCDCKRKPAKQPELFGVTP